MRLDANTQTSLQCSVLFFNHPFKDLSYCFTISLYLHNSLNSGRLDGYNYNLSIIFSTNRNLLSQKRPNKMNKALFVQFNTTSACVVCSEVVSFYPEKVFHSSFTYECSRFKLYTST